MSFSFSKINYIHNRNNLLLNVGSFLSEKEKRIIDLVSRTWNQAVSWQSEFGRDLTKQLHVITYDISEVLSKLTHLQRVALLCSLSDQKRNKMTSLKLCNVSDNELKEILPFFPNLKHLSVVSHYLNGSFLEEETISNKLESLHLEGRLLLYCELNKGLEKFSHLKKLELSSIGIHEEFFQEIKSVNTLEELSWLGPFGENDLDSILDKFPNLHCLKITTYGLRAEVLKRLDQSTKLKKLYTNFSMDDVGSIDNSCLRKILQNSRGINWNQRSFFLLEYTRRIRRNKDLSV
jgi:hypothetical protein